MAGAHLGALSERIIGCAIEVHRHLGPGLAEFAYESALCIELKALGLQFARQLGVPVFYKGKLIAEHRPDLIVEGAVIVEVKSIEQFHPVHISQMLTYLRVTHLTVGLLLNFNSVVLREGIRRVVL